MFHPEGVGLDFGSGEYRYLAFERSNSMSRQARLSFIRADYYDAVRRRIMLDMEIGQPVIELERAVVVDPADNVGRLALCTCQSQPSEQHDR